LDAVEDTLVDPPTSTTMVCVSRRGR
jgi:hypothetical protein